MKDNNKPNSFIEWLGYTTEPEYSQHFWLGIIIGGILSVFIASALLITSVYFLGALTGGKGITESVSGEAALNYLLIIGGIVGAPFVVWRILVNQKLADIAEQGLITDRLNKAVEQLGAEKTILKCGGFEKAVPNLAVRLGAIYSLERIAKDSVRDLIPIMKILTAYIRNNAPAKVQQTIRTTIPRQDIEAAINVIGKRNMEDFNAAIEKDAKGSRQEYQLDLRNCNLNYMSMNDLNFESALFMRTQFGRADLRGAKLQFSDMREADFRYANLEDANLEDANLKLVAVKGTNFSDCDGLSGAQVESMFGCATTILPEQLGKPEWRNWTPEDDEFGKKWRAAKAAANP